MRKEGKEEILEIEIETETGTATNDQLSTLSREELVEMVNKQQRQIDELTNPPPNDWHSLFFALLRAYFYKYPKVDVMREVVLGAQPPRADFVLVRDDDVEDLGLEIFKIFRKNKIFREPRSTSTSFGIFYGC